MRSSKIRKRFLKIEFQEFEVLFTFSGAIPEFSFRIAISSWFSCSLHCSCWKKPPEAFYKKKLFLKLFAIFTGKHLCWSLFLIKLQVSRPALIKRDSNTGAFLWISKKFLRTPTFKNICEWLLLFLLSGL